MSHRIALVAALACASACAPGASSSPAPKASAAPLGPADQPAMVIGGEAPEGPDGMAREESGGRDPQAAPEGLGTWDDLGGDTCGPLRSAHAVRVLPVGGGDDGSWSFTLMTDQRVTCDDIAESIQMEIDQKYATGPTPSSPAAACKARQEARMTWLEASDLRGEYAGCAVRIDDQPNAFPAVVLGQSTEALAAAAFMADCDGVETWDDLAAAESEAQAALTKATGGAVVWAEMHGRPTDRQGPPSVEAVLTVTTETPASETEQRVAVQARLMDCVVELLPAFDDLALR